MKIEHIRLWADDLELIRQFYLKYFDISSREKYTRVLSFEYRTFSR